MSKYIKQFIKNQSDENWNDEVELLTAGEQVVTLGIQAAPGTLFRLNGGSQMQMGFFGTYELDLSSMGGVITSIRVAKAGSYPKNSKVIVDVLYESSGGGN